MIQQAVEMKTTIDYLSAGLSTWMKLGYLPREAWKEMGDQEWIGLSSRAESGLESYYSLCQELAVHKSVGLIGTYSVNEIALRLLRRFRNPAAEKAAEEIRTGNKNIALCISEENAGSDINKLTTQAIAADNEGYMITGKKMYITNAPIADYFLVAARTNEAGEAWKSISLFLVERHQKGIDVSEETDKAGARLMPFGEVHFADCPVAADCLLGRKNRGFEYLAGALDFERTLISIMALSMSEMIFTELTEHLNRREIFGKRLIEFQRNKFLISDFYSKISVLKQFVLNLINDLKQNQADKNHVFVAKIQSTELLRELADAALQLYGAKGYVSDHWIANLYNDIRWLSIGGGANEMLKDMLGNKVVRNPKI
ncbi:acyl-CoA dehydrogenase family protein [Paenibacillus tianjinensis]|uniref:Acyl-CoA dehydrogenase family protein n=1 Tax=Paenibacillus tianjinensis TaxID=2810347 RepID=A0ABX7L911_9BACL|nr:acyl-CoA dehydrogenase family protein [Paenibacillus tianjinensis]QSF44391.1 acyl-CoA dehydrogenase family protein [Paenibacillus tianjinensis]